MRATEIKKDERGGGNGKRSPVFLTHVILYEMLNKSL